MKFFWRKYVKTICIEARTMKNAGQRFSAFCKYHAGKLADETAAKKSLLPDLCTSAEENWYSQLTDTYQSFLPARRRFLRCWPGFLHLMTKAAVFCR